MARNQSAVRRLELHEKLCELLGNRRVYFQRPEEGRLKYPCIIYEKSTITHQYADDAAYLKNDQYQIMLITKNPDDELIETLSWFKTARFDRVYVRDNLYHYLFSLYY